MDTTNITAVTEEALLRFMEYHPPDRASKNLRKLLIQCLEDDSIIEDVCFNDIIHDVRGIFDLLDALSAVEP